MNSPPRWFQLIDFQQQVRGGYGLTIPYLIGASAPRNEGIVSPDMARVRIHDILSCFVSEVPAPHVIFISRCRELGQPVAALHFTDYGLPNGLESIPQGRKTLFVEKEFVAGPSYSITSLTDMFFSELCVPICEKRYSFQGKAYVPFLPIDLELIKLSGSM